MPRVDQAEVADRGKGDQPPEIALHQRQAGAVKDADDRQRNQQRRDGARLGREEADMKAQHGVKAELAGHHHGQGDGASLKVSASQPCSGKTGTLTAKANRNASAHQKAPRRESAGGDVELQLREVESAGLGVEPQDGDQQRRRGNECEQEELGRRPWVRPCGRTWRSAPPWAPARVPRSRSRPSGRARRRRRTWRSAAPGRASRRPCGAP